MCVKAENMYRARVENATTIWFIFHNFPAPRPGSTTFSGTYSLMSRQSVG